MAKIVVPTQFNKSGKRVLEAPIDEKKICAPAYQEYRRKRKAIQNEWLQKWNDEKIKYISNMSQCIASYLASNSVRTDDVYEIAKFIVEQWMIERFNVNIENGRMARVESITLELSKIPELFRIEKEFKVAIGRIYDEKEAAFEEAERELMAKKRALQKEVSDHIHNQFHPENKS